MSGAASSILLVLLDLATVALTILFATIVAVDGFVLRIAELQVRFRTPWRTLAWLAAVVIVRLVLDRRTPPFNLQRLIPAIARQPVRIELLLVAGLFCVPLFVGLGATDMENDEAIYSYAVDRILETGDWLTPQSIPGDGPFLEKPPLKFWIVAGAIRLGVLPHNEFGLRFFDALFGAFAFLYVARLGQRLAGPGCGFIACFVLFAIDSLLFDHGLRSNNMDAALILAYCGGLYHFSRWVEGTPDGVPDDSAILRRHALAVAGFITLGFMTKFVAVFFLPLVCGLAFLWRRDAFRRLRSDWTHWVAPVLLTLALIAPWFVYQTAIGSPVWQQMFGVHVFERFTAALDAGHLKPWHFYYSWTWGELVFAGTHWLVALGVPMLAWKAWSGRPWLARLVLLWWLVPFALLALTTSKLSHYIYPFLPPLALGAGWIAVALFRAIDRAAVPSVPAFARRVAAVAVVAVMLPLGTYAAQARQLVRPGAPLRALRDCAVAVPALRETRLYMSYWNRLMHHGFYYYLRRVGPWVESERLDPEDVQRRLFNPAHQTLVVLTLEDYEALPPPPRAELPAIAFLERVVVLTPGPFAACGAAAVAAGGAAFGEGLPPRGRHWH